ncbi:hypothetical protein Vretifemale_1633 [Volvox reticuliferus]|uniref:Uncharacterized protein n=1 Tax=Volvox reticuliferus TaxID=1737510 RepID=A0A8J4FGD6_9CHLO|nr:hypothetical protein Vretifemale_1633 [Volvox reticuliferus]
MAKWLFQSRGWLVPAEASSLSTIIRGYFALRYTIHEPAILDSRLNVLGCCRPSLAALQSAAQPYSTTPMAATGASTTGFNTAESSDGNSKGLVMPRWLRSLFPGFNKAMVDPAGPLVSNTIKDSADAEDLKVLEELRNMSMAGYVEYCKKMRSGSTPPIPRLPPLRFGRAEHRAWVDEARVSFLRLMQHERIGSLVTKEESELILAKGKDVLYDRAFMEAIADRTGMYIDLEVKDCIEQFLDLRKKTERLHRFVTEFGHALPKTVKEQQYALRFMERKEEEESLQASLARRDTAGCPLRQKLSWSGSSALCELTGRPYWQCCGRASAGTQATDMPDRLALQLHPKQPRRDELLADPERERVAHRRFRGHVASKFRKAYIEASKPRLRRGVGHASAFFWKHEQMKVS